MAAAPLVLVAIGGNALARAGQAGTIEEQSGNARRVAAEIAGILQDGWRAVVTHGNGPQVGSALLRSELAAGDTHRLPLDVCVAETQGSIGYLLQRALRDELDRCGMAWPVVSVITQVEVRPDDPAMNEPSKPIGPFLSEREAERRRERGWNVIDDAGRGYRRIVPSPEPVAVLELEAVRALSDRGCVVVAAGGGGVPVARGPSGLCGVEAVVDKDRSSALLALGLFADTLLIATGEERIALGYRTERQQWLDEMTVAEARQHHAAGEFPPGSMGPKVEAAIDFVLGGGRLAIVTSLERTRDALRGRAGTRIVVKRARS